MVDFYERYQMLTLSCQVLFPLVQGVIWTLVLAGWRHWNQASRFSGATIGARIRRWWWGVNNWKIPEKPKSNSFAAKMGEFYTAQASAVSD